ncbi:MAG: hypothetical protein II499_04855, partial [Firmicutes bacterium]|nr:hypothetical protein [Bacillota bacterium]
KARSAGGYLWSYADDSSYIPDQMQKLKGKYRDVAVYQYDRNGILIAKHHDVYADSLLGFNSNNIVQVCRHKNSHHKGYIWRFEGDISGINTLSREKDEN